MGGSSSKTEEQTDNKGLLNGNFINNGQIIERIEKDLTSETLLLKFVIFVNCVHILIVLIKMFIKYLKRRNTQERKIDEILLSANRAS